MTRDVERVLQHFDTSITYFDASQPRLPSNGLSPSPTSGVHA
ncbi:MAG: hypothetical protein ABWY19_07280 [Marmoricola sp.]